MLPGIKAGGYVAQPVFRFQSPKQELTVGNEEMIRVTEMMRARKPALEGTVIGA